MANSTSSKPTQDGPVQGSAPLDPARTLPHDPHGHGNSVAAWTAVTVVMLGSLLLAIGVGIANVPLAIVGGVIALLGGPVGKVLGALGFGSPPPSTH